MVQLHSMRSKSGYRALMFAALSTAAVSAARADLVVTNLSDSGSDSLRDAILTADHDTSGNPITIDIEVTGIPSTAPRAHCRLPIQSSSTPPAR
jgi:hypothetical protein